MPRLARFSGQLHAIAIWGYSSYLQSSTFHLVRIPQSQFQPALWFGRYPPQLVLELADLIGADWHFAVVGLFFNSWITVAVLTCSTQAISRMPLPLSVISTICCLTCLVRPG
jgi:hypothetical protein